MFASEFRNKISRLVKDFKIVEASYENTDCTEEIVLSQNEFTIKIAEDFREQSFVVNVKEGDNYILKAAFKNIYSFSEKYDISELKADLAKANCDMWELHAYINFFIKNKIIKKKTWSEVMHEFIPLERLGDTIRFYCEKELESIKQSDYVIKLNELANRLGFRVECSYSHGGIDNNPRFTYLGVDVVDEKGEIVVVDEIEYDVLSYALTIVIIDKKGRIKFNSWEEDYDFVDTLDWMIEELEKKIKESK